MSRCSGRCRTAASCSELARCVGLGLHEQPVLRAECAFLVCLGLWVSFGSQVDASQTWSLLLGMAGYTLLLAVTACLLVRFVGVWDDVRTVMLLVVLLFLATSVTFDEVVARDPGRGCLLSGWALVRGGGQRGDAARGFLGDCRRSLACCIILSSPYSSFIRWCLRGSSIDRIASNCRGPCLAFRPPRCLFFSHSCPRSGAVATTWRDNGSPWPWAWYPWTLFGVLAFAVPARSARSRWSMHHVPSAGGEPYIFGPYFLVPFGMAIAAVLLEIGLVERRRGVAVGALLVPPILVLLTLVGHCADPTYQWFLDRFVARLGGTPFYLTLLISAGFFAYAVLRGVPTALDALMAAMVALAFVSPGTLDLGDLVCAANAADPGGGRCADGDWFVAPQSRTQRDRFGLDGGGRHDRCAWDELTAIRGPSPFTSRRSRALRRRGVR